ncbi:MAG: LapA family protein [Rhodocyclaceae bacterium]|nr:LapA family protein [Rhodocyclaceae bacterium]
MRFLIWIFRIVLFVFLFGFAVKNDELVNVQFFLGEVRQFPLVFVMLAFFAGGAVIGFSVTLVSLFSKKREIARLKKQVRQLEREAELLQPPRIEGPPPEAH